MEFTVENGASNFGDDRAPAGRRRDSLPLLLTVDEAAALLRTTRRAIYAMIERRQVAGVIRIRRRVLFRADYLLQVVAESQENNGISRLRSVRATADCRAQAWCGRVPDAVVGR